MDGPRIDGHYNHSFTGDILVIVTGIWGSLETRKTQVVGVPLKGTAGTEVLGQI